MRSLSRLPALEAPERVLAMLWLTALRLSAARILALAYGNSAGQTDSKSQTIAACTATDWACMPASMVSSLFTGAMTDMANFLKHSFVLRGAMAVAMALGAYAVQAQSTASSVCADGKQDQAACEREMGATRKKTPTDPNQDFASNALKRCQVFANDPEARQSCEDRVRNQNTRRDGSVFEGGTFQEHRIIQTVPAPRPVQ